MSIESKVGGVNKLINRLAGILGVASLWTVDPTDLDHATDNDWTTVTGEGNKVMGAAGDYGRIVWDMGAIYNVIVVIKIHSGTTVGGEGVEVADFSEDGVNYKGGSPNWGSTLDGWRDNTDLFFIVFGRGRYFRLTWHANGAATWHGSVYEVKALDLGV